MTASARDWDAEDPYAGQACPSAPPWLPDAADLLAVRRPAARGDAAAARAGTEHPTAERPEPPADGRSPWGQPPLPMPDTGPDAGRTRPLPAAPVPPPPPVPLLPESAEDPAATWEYVPLGLDPDGDNLEGLHNGVDLGKPPSGVLPAGTSPSGILPAGAPPHDATEPAGLPGQVWFEDDRDRRPWFLIAVGAGLVVLLAVIVTAFLVLGGDAGGNGQARPSGPASPPPATGPVGARPVAADRVPALAPQNVAVGTFGDQLQVTWSPPREAGSASGYFVVSQNRDGNIVERKLVASDADLSVVFDDASLCAVVTTIVSEPGGLQLARGGLVCPVSTAAPEAAPAPPSS